MGANSCRTSSISGETVSGFYFFFFLNKELTYVPSNFYALPVLKTSGTEATLNLSSQNYGHLSSVIKPCLIQLLQNTPLKPVAKACKKKNYI